MQDFFQIHNILKYEIIYSKNFVLRENLVFFLANYYTSFK
jgi:hypothetical protein